MDPSRSIPGVWSNSITYKYRSSLDLLGTALRDGEVILILNEGWPHPDAPDIKQKYGEFFPLSNEGSWNVMNVGSNTCVRVSGGDR